PVQVNEPPAGMVRFPVPPRRPLWTTVVACASAESRLKLALPSIVVLPVMAYVPLTWISPLKRTSPGPERLDVLVNVGPPFDPGKSSVVPAATVKVPPLTPLFANQASLPCLRSNAPSLFTA